jgi:hypothetical protein
MLHEHRVIYSTRYYLRFHITVVGLGEYYPRIWGNYYTFVRKQKKLLPFIAPIYELLNMK